MGFDEMEPIFGRINAEWSAPHKTPLKPFLFHVHGLPSDPSTLHVCATDFHSNTWDALKSAQELEDMRDRTGIGGSWSDFVDYLIAAVKSEDVKLVMDGQSKVGGLNQYMKLFVKSGPKNYTDILLPVLHMQNWLPRKQRGCQESLYHLVNLWILQQLKQWQIFLWSSTQHSQMYIICLKLVCTLIQKQRCCELTNVLSEEKEKNETAQKQLDALLYSKRQKITENTASDTATVSSSLESPVKQAAQHPSTKVTNRVVPAHRRARVRGVLLHDIEEERQD